MRNLAVFGHTGPPPKSPSPSRKASPPPLQPEKEKWPKLRPSPMLAPTSSSLPTPARLPGPDAGTVQASAAGLTSPSKQVVASPGAGKRLVQSAFGGGWTQIEEPDEDKPSKMMTAAEREALKYYYVAEDEWKTCPKFIFFPVSGLKQAWDFLIMVLVIYACVVIPYRAAFEEAEGAWFWFEAGLQLVFCLDVLLNFNTAYLENERWYLSRGKIAKRYLAGWFWIDFPSSIPFDLVELYALPQLRDAVGGGEALETMLPMMRALRLFKLLRLINLLRVGEQVAAIEDRTGYNLKALRIVNTVIFLLIFCHVLACMFYAIAIATEEHDDVPKTWVTFFDGGYMQEEGTPVFDAYIIAYLWAIGLVCGQNTNITPESMMDRVVSIWVYLFATLFFAYIIAVVTDQLGAYVNDPRSNKVDALVAFIRFHKIDSEGRDSLGEKLKAYVTNFYASRSMIDEDELIATLTPSLRDAVMDHLLSSTVRTCPLLHPALQIEGIEEERVQDFQEAIYRDIRPVCYERRDLVLAKNQKSEDLYFLRKGQVNAVSCAAGGRVGRGGGAEYSLDKTLFPIDDVGEFFGEQCLLGEASEVTFIAALRTEVLCVPMDTLIDAANEHLDDELRAQLGESVFEDIERKATLRLWGMRIQMAELIEENNKKGLKMMADEFVTALIIQVWYLNGKLKRMRGKSAVQLLSELEGDEKAVPIKELKIGGDDDEGGSGGDKEKEKASRKEEKASRKEGPSKGGAASASSAEVVKLAAEVSTLSGKMEKIEKRMGSLDAKMDKLMEKLERKLGGPGGYTA